MTTLELPCGVEILPRQLCDSRPGYPLVVNDIFHNGIFIIGSSSDSQLQTYLKRLAATNWRYLFDYGMSEADPLEWIDRVRIEAWTFTDFTRIEMPDSNGRGQFSGNVVQYSAAFSFWIWDLELLEQICRRAPEVRVIPERPSCRILVAQ